MATNSRRNSPTNSPGNPDARTTAKSTPGFLVGAFLLAAFLILGAAAVLVVELYGGSRGAAGRLFASAIGGPFQLVDQNGRTVTNTELEGKWLLVYFGYTHCPDACPTALNNIAVALDDLGPQRNEVRPVFISIDPARDTPKVMKAYVTAFDAPILALTGTAAQVAKAASDYRVYYAKHPEAGGDYSMDHSSIIYVMDPKGRFTASFSGEDAPTEMVERLKKLLA